MANSKKASTQPTEMTQVPGLWEMKRKQIRELTKGMSDAEARFLVKGYYTLQNTRIRLTQQVNELIKSGATSAMLAKQADMFADSEKAMKLALSDYTDNHPMGEWMKQIYGIGPVISAGILAMVDIERCHTAGSLHAYAGLDPHRPTNVSKERLGTYPPNIMAGNELNFQRYLDNKKRYWNADMKRLAWLIGQSFMKFSGRKECLYGHAYLKRKEYEVYQNESGMNAAYAARQLEWKDFGDNATRKCLEQGKLSLAHLDARARRHTVKLFLSHLQQVWYEKHFGRPAPLPYAISHLHHAHFILPEHMQFVKTDENTIDNFEGSPDQEEGM